MNQNIRQMKKERIKTKKQIIKKDNDCEDAWVKIWRMPKIVNFG